jgi:REP-associated tyrosine transposase
MPRSSYRFIEKDQPHFVTSTVVEWLPLFTNPDIVEIVFESLRFMQRERGLVIYAYVILENHIHMIASCSDLSKSMKEFKSFTATQIIDYLEDRKSSGMLGMLRRAKLPHKTGSKHQVWQEGSHPELISSLEIMRQKVEYIHNNPVKRGYVDEPAHWRYSSARNYAGEKGIIDVQTEWWEE